MGTPKIFAYLTLLFFLLCYGGSAFLLGRHVEKQNTTIIVEPMMILIEDARVKPEKPNGSPHGDKGNKGDFPTFIK